ncbi:bZIP transcription factor 2-like [Cynara cardunculus var. scolymus]|uniref:Basic-leucine zipper domain-containing protein n=1 Tax=Cynara cardunculus var. scolymus TaxID=59895 RepID=A0A103Y5G1_CYNCS|nr:bZIP transcription factor 2-like [Cynara cardunculus var. scolymus]KVI02876.1 Basic-leucine zipper domain-containing protein [Cynara cardunculus var. scolymus]
MAAAGVMKSTESTQLPVLGSDDHHDSVSKKQKRMISNRESARRSRIRKKKHADDLIGQVSQLVSDNKYMAINLRDTTRMFLQMDSENSVLRAQLAELTHRFESLNEINNGFNSLSGYHEHLFLLPYNNMLHNDQHFRVDMFLN